MILTLVHLIDGTVNSRVVILDVRKHVAQIIKTAADMPAMSGQISSNIDSVVADHHLICERAHYSKPQRPSALPNARVIFVKPPLLEKTIPEHFDSIVEKHGQRTAYGL